MSDTSDWISHPRRALRNTLDPSLRLRLRLARQHRDPRLLIRPQAAIERQHLEELYRDVHGQPPDLDAPRTFSEKIQWRKLYDRRDVFTRLVDKLAVRHYVASRAGEEHLIPLLAVGDSTSGIPFDDLAPPYIVKPSNASGTTARIRDRSELDVEAVARALDPLVADPYAISAVEWAYWTIPRRVMVERLLLRPDGQVPYDYKVHTFGGRARFIEVHLDRFTDRSCSIFDRDWRLTDAGYLTRASGGRMKRPARLDRMLELAENLAAGLDYLRVDLYRVDDRIFVGELTVYPASGLRRFDPPEWDLRWGQLWTLPERVRRP